MTMAEQISKTELMDRIAASYEAVEHVVAGLDGLLLSRPGPEGWAVKDHLLHLASGERGIAWLLSQRSRYEGMGVTAEEWQTHTMDEINHLIYQRTRNRDAAQALAALRAAHQELLDALAPLDDEELQRPYSDFEPGATRDAARPISGVIIGDTYRHFDDHLGYIRTLLDR